MKFRICDHLYIIQCLRNNKYTYFTNILVHQNILLFVSNSGVLTRDNYVLIFYTRHIMMSLMPTKYL